MFRLKKDPVEIQANVYSGVHRKILNICIVISFLVLLIFAVSDLLHLLDMGNDYLFFDFPARIAGLVVAFIFNNKYKTEIAKYIFIVVFIVFSIRLLIINTSVSILPIILSFFLLYPVYISFFINPKAGLYSGVGFIVLICSYYFYVRVWQPYLFVQKHTISFTNVFLTPLVMITFISVIFYYFGKQNKKYIQQIDQYSFHTQFCHRCIIST